jgi:hypothetical protein
VVAAIALAVAAGCAGRTSSLVLASLAGYLILIHTLVLAAGLLGHLTTLGLVILLAPVVIVALGLARRPGGGASDEGQAPGLIGWLGSLVAIGALAIWAWPHLWRATRLWVWDDYTYHMVYPALWLRDHAIATPVPAQSFTMQAWYPLSASVVAAWFMAPLAGGRGETLAWVTLTGVLYAGLAAAAAAVLLARAGCRAGVWVVPALLFATSPRIAIMASSFSDADLAVAATLAGALAFAVAPQDDAGPRLSADAGYAGLLSGLALGIKVSAAPLALVVLGLVAWRGRAVQRAFSGGLTVAAAWMLTAGYWYLRNLLATGNPLYPAAFLGRPGTTFPETTLREYAHVYGLRRTLADALMVYADWPRSHAALAVVGLLGLAIWLLARRCSATRSQRQLGAATLVSSALILLLLPLAPYSAGNAMTFRSGFVHWDSMRYVALVPILGWMSLGFLVDRLLPRSAILPGERGMTPAWRWLTRSGRWSTPYCRALALLVIALGGGAFVATHHAAKATATAQAIAHDPLFGATTTALDRLPPGTRVAIFGDQWIYPAFGDHGQLRPLRLDADGRLATTSIGNAMEPGDLTVDASAFRANLAAAGMGAVVIVHLPHPGRSPAWPAQDAALRTFPDAHLLHRDFAAAVWRLGP